MLFRSSGRLVPATAGALLVSALPVAAAAAVASGLAPGSEDSARPRGPAATAVLRAARGVPLIDITPANLTAAKTKPLHPREALVPARPMASEPPPPPLIPRAVARVAPSAPAPVATPTASATPAAPATAAEAPIASERLRQTGRAVLMMLAGFALLLVTAVFLRLSATRRALPARA